MNIRRPLSLVAAALLSATLLAPAHAYAPASQLDAPVAIVAHPALWTVHGKTGTIYLLGSLHLLPPDVVWHTDQIDTAMAASDTFLFEAPTDQSGQEAARAFIAAHGLQPKGETLSHTPAARCDGRLQLCAGEIACRAGGAGR
jgi:hypothetical protein